MFETIFRGFRNSSLSLYIRLIQASNNPKLILSRLNQEELMLFNSEEYSDDFTQNRIAEKNYLTESDKDFINSFDMTSKFYKGVELVKDLTNKGKVIVWGIFIDTINRINTELIKKGIKSSVITGSVPLDEREKILNDFIEGDIQVLITNPHTLGESISLHKTCHQAVYFEYSFNLVHMLQSRDRIHRLGLEDNEETDYYYLQLDSPHSIYSPIDRKIYLRLLEKENLQSFALSSKNISYIVENVEDDIKILFG